MPLFWLTYVTRSFLRSGRRALFAVICVVVGVTGVVALETASLTVQNALTSNVRASNGGDISLTSDQAPLSRSDLAVFSRLQRRGQISSWTAIWSVHATAVGPNGRLVPFDVDLVTVPPYPLGGQPTFVSPSGGNVARLLVHHGDVLLTNVLAQELNAGVGSRLLVNGIGGSGLRATVRGVLSESSFEHSAALTAELRDAAALTNAPPSYSAVYLDVPGPSQPVARLLRSRFPTATVQTVSEALQQAESQVHDFHQFLLLVGLLALLIAGVGILNAMQSILASRRLEIAMLKALGYRQPMLYLLFGGEALLIGLVGGLAGTALGTLGSKLITDVLARAQAITVTYVVDAGTLLAGVALGVGATLLFAILPIVRAAGLRPLEILREGTPVTLSQWPRTILLLAIMFLLFTVLTAVAVGDGVLAAQFVAGAAAACLVLVGLFALAVAAVGRLGPTPSRPLGLGILLALLLLTALAVLRLPAVAAIVALGAVLFGLTVLLPRPRVLPLLIAGRSLARRRARTSVLLVAFLAGVLSMTVTLTVATGLQSQINDALASNGAANLVAVAGAGEGSRIVRAARALPGIRGRTVMTTINTEPLRLNGRPLASVIGPAPVGGDQEDNGRHAWTLSGLTGWQLASGQQPPNITLLRGRPLTPADAGTNHVLLYHALLGSPYFLQPGDTVTLREPGSGRVRTVQAVGFYELQRRGNRFGAFFTPPIYADQKLALQLGGADAQTVVTFSAAQSWLAHDAAALQRALPGTLVIDVGDLTAVVDTILDELLHVLAVMTLLVLGAGVAVVANGVALAMLERRREIALFKAIGFSPGSVQSFVLVENALLGTLAGAASVLATALALALLSHFALQQAIGFDPGLAVLVLVIAALVAVATAYLVARAPIQVRPLEALRNE